MSTNHQYAGCPDLIGEIGGVRVIADFKTSNAPYCATFPDRGDRIGFGGYRKYTVRSTDGGLQVRVE